MLFAAVMAEDLAAHGDVSILEEFARSEGLAPVRPRNTRSPLMHSRPHPRPPAPTHRPARRYCCIHALLTDMNGWALAASTGDHAAQERSQQMFVSVQQVQLTGGTTCVSRRTVHQSTHILQARMWRLRWTGSARRRQPARRPHPCARGQPSMPHSTCSRPSDRALRSHKQHNQNNVGGERQGQAHQEGYIFKCRQPHWHVHLPRH